MANSAMAMKERGIEPTYSLIIAQCPNASPIPKCSTVQAVSFERFVECCGLHTRLECELYGRLYCGLYCGLYGGLYCGLYYRVYCGIYCEPYCRVYS